ncbi:hypothetical protein SLEP1_g56142 [Rubroshorea leprosula]|uniref:DUF4220 domain-containing protein n=1 Tax=Rubroshorea leprosula TaxID=152421 RepID=A0AAV5MHH1_9ROSI|nr:hypothetical protein SLEP1_g56142 [Rubroshorea leprosula]
MVFSIPDNVMKLWDAWNVRAFVILSLLAQVFLTLFAPLRKRLGGIWGKCVYMLIWLVYLLADWVAGLTVGSILSNQLKIPANSGDIQAFWAPFLLLHLGGPDTIASFALEDNELWVRHLLGLILQVGSTLYVFLMSLPDNKLWLPTFLVLIASIVKYAERNRAFYLASSDHFGENWVPGERVAGLHIPKQFKKLETADPVPYGLEDDDIQPFYVNPGPFFINPGSFYEPSEFLVDSDPKSILQAAAYLFGTIRRPLLGSFLSKYQCLKSFANFGSKNKECYAKDALLKIEIQLSLLFEALHTKLPVIVSKAGCISRILNLSCIVGALLSFSLVKKHYELNEFDTWLTYGLLIGALTLDFISIILLVFSDWFLIANFHNSGCFRVLRSRLKARRWSNKVPQLNFITYSVKDHPNWLNSLATFLPLRSLLEAMKVIRCLSFQNFGDDPHYWRCIFEDVQDVIRRGDLKVDVDFAQNLLDFHIATELSIQGDFQGSSPGSTEKDRTICKLISDYMFYLMKMEPAMMATVSNNWENVLKDAHKETLSILDWSLVSNEKDASSKILSAKFEKGKTLKMLSTARGKRLVMELEVGTISWEELRKGWVKVMCHAARKCRPSVHSQQPSKGGELLTFIWLCMANFTMAKYGSPYIYWS